MTLTDAQIYYVMEKSPIYFIRTVWGLSPQPVKRKYAARLQLGLLLKGKEWDKFCTTVKPHWFGVYLPDRHLTWQQSLALWGIEKAIRGEVPMRISIVSGHGIGKSALLAMLILWFLYVHPQSQIATTSPSKEQMYDVLWKELKKWIDKMPPGMADFFQWETSHVRMKEAPATWFARAKTSSKENTEALAGVHADWVFVAVDEASGVEEPIFETMEGALTSGNILVFLISNGTRNTGYFYDTHHRDAQRWQNYAFDAEESPRVSPQSVQDWREKYGEESLQYFIRVKGKFPGEGVMDDKGYIQLFDEQKLRFTPYQKDAKFTGRVIGALDPAGEGQDTADWAARDRLLARIVHTEKSSNEKTLAAASISLCDRFWIDPIDLVIDAFGVGHKVAQEIALMTSQQKRPWRVTPVNTGEPCDDEYDRELYINKRAEGFYKMMLWVASGGTFMECATPEETTLLKRELLSIRLKRTLSGRIQIMDKVQMKKLGLNGGSSPNKADALSMTFLRPDGAKRSLWGNTPEELGSPQFDPYATAGEV